MILVNTAMTDSSSLYNYRNYALIVWDVQYGITSRTIDLQSSLKNIRRLIDVTHARKMPVIYSQSTGLPYEYQSGYNKFWQLRRGIDPKVPKMVEKSHEWEILTEVAPTKEDIVLKKSTHSLFVGTLLENLLRNRRTEVVVLTGYSTEVGIETTARHAGALGFIPVIAEDAIGSSEKEMHDASMKVMRKLFEVKNASEIVQGIESS
ncbi:MAG: cysteine hydrolase family protein [Nitrososphaerales archaeon]